MNNQTHASKPFAVAPDCKNCRKHVDCQLHYEVRHGHFTSVHTGVVDHLLAEFCEHYDDTLLDHAKGIDRVIEMMMMPGVKI